MIKNHSRLSAISLLTSMALMTTGISGNIWAEELGEGDPNEPPKRAPRKVPADDLPIGEEAMAAISKAEAKRLRKQAKRISK